MIYTNFISLSVRIMASAENC